MRTARRSRTSRKLAYIPLCTCTSGAGDEWKVYHCELHQAAPDMLFALRDCVAAFDNDIDKNFYGGQGAIARAKLAIIKATGEQETK